MDRTTSGVECQAPAPQIPEPAKRISPWRPTASRICWCPGRCSKASRPCRHGYARIGEAASCWPNVHRARQRPCEIGRTYWRACSPIVNIVGDQGKRPSVLFDPAFDRATLEGLGAPVSAWTCVRSRRRRWEGRASGVQVRALALARSRPDRHQRDQLGRRRKRGRRSTACASGKVAPTCHRRPVAEVLRGKDDINAGRSTVRHRRSPTLHGSRHHHRRATGEIMPASTLGVAGNLIARLAETLMISWSRLIRNEKLILAGTMPPVVRSPYPAGDLVEGSRRFHVLARPGSGYRRCIGRGSPMNRFDTRPDRAGRQLADPIRTQRRRGNDHAHPRCDAAR